MIDYVLILTFYASTLASGDAVSMTTVPNFLNEKECVTAGQKASSQFGTLKKSVSFVCVKRTGAESKRD